MASISSLSGSSASSSIYGNRNIFTGLASGMDTESMIENSIQGYKTKIQSLIGQQTSLTWKQDAVRSITDKMIALSNKYTSYTSTTNLTSPSFFNNAVTTTTGGKNADKVAASGKGTSDVEINAVKQLATAARYAVSAEGLFGVDGSATGEKIDLSSTKVSKVSGSMTLSVGNANKSVTLNFDQTDTYKNAGELVDAINDKLKNQTIGDVAADTMIKAVQDGGSIKFVAGTGAGKGDAVWISGANGNIESTLGLKPTQTYQGTEKSQSSVTVPDGNLWEKQDAVKALSNKTVSVTLDGVTKKISLGDLKVTDDDPEGTKVEDKLRDNLQDGLKSAFGGKVSVEMKDGALSFSTNSQGSSLKVTSEVGAALGLGSNGVTNYLDTRKTLGDLIGEDMSGLEALDAVGEVKSKDGDSYSFYDEAGNKVKQVQGKWKRVDNDGNLLYGLTLNDKQVGAFTRETALDKVISSINNSDAGVKVNYSQLTNKFTFTATETGAQGRIDFGDGLGQKLFGPTGLNMDTATGVGILTDGSGKKLVAGVDEKYGTYYIGQNSDGKYYKVNDAGKVLRGSPEITQDNPEFAGIFTKARVGYTAGQDAIFSTTVNGEEMTLTRSSNVVSIDGLSVTLKGTFNEDNIISSGKDYILDPNKTIETDSAVTFTTKADADKIVEAVKSFVNDYNAIVKEARSAYSTTPLTDTSKNRYSPLTDEQKEDMSESEITRYEEKAKTGILFGDTDLRRAYESLRSAITASGDDRKAMEAIGLTTGYSDGVTTLELDEGKLRAALESNPDAVQKTFTNSLESGASSNGLMARVKKTMNTYASTSIGNYGVLVQKAGTRTSSLTLMNNSIQKQIDSLDKQIDTWQTRMSDKIDYYTRQFTALEQLMNEMNSQSSALAGLMGY